MWRSRLLQIKKGLSISLVPSKDVLRNIFTDSIVHEEGNMSMVDPLITSDPIADAERYANREMPVRGICEQCGQEIYTWEDYYDVEGTLLHYDECGHNWLRKYLKLIY